MIHSYESKLLAYQIVEDLQSYYIKAIYEKTLDYDQAVAYEYIYRTIKVLLHKNEITTHDLDYAFSKLEIAMSLLKSYEQKGKDKR